MLDWQHRLNGDPLSWLLEPDPDNPGVRYFALRDLLDRPEDDPEVRSARSAIMATGPVPAILDAQYPDGFWMKAGGGYSPSNTARTASQAARSGAQINPPVIRAGLYSAPSNCAE